MHYLRRLACLIGYHVPAMPPADVVNRLAAALSEQEVPRPYYLMCRCRHCPRTVEVRVIQ